MSLTSVSDLLAVASTNDFAVPQANSAAEQGVGKSDLVGTVARLVATSRATPAALLPVADAAADVADPPVADDPPADPPPTNFPGPRPSFGTPAYFAQLAFAVFHVIALPITVPVQAIIGSADGVPTVIAAALNDLSGLLGEIPGLSTQQPAAAQIQQKVSEASPVQKLAAAEVADPPVADDPPADPLPTNFPGPRPSFGTPAYFAQLAFAVLHVIALPITVPVQAIIGKADGVPSVIVAALNDLSSLLGQVPKLPAPQADAQTAQETPLSQRITQTVAKLDAAFEKPDAATSDVNAKTPKAEHEATEHDGKSVDKPTEATADSPSEAPKAESPKATESKVEPAPVKSTEPKVDPVASEPVKPEVTKPEPAKPESAKPEPTKPEVTNPEPVKLNPTKPEVTNPEPVKPDVSRPVKVIRDSLKSTPGETATTGGTKTTEGSKGATTEGSKGATTEGSKGAEAENKGPDTSPGTKVREGLKSTPSGKSDKPAEKPSADKSSSEKGASSSEGNSHTSEGKAHTSEGKSHSGSTG